MTRTNIVVIVAFLAGLLIGFLVGDSFNIGRSRIAAAEAKVEQVKLQTKIDKLKAENDFRVELIAEGKATEARLKDENVELQKTLDLADSIRPPGTASEPDPNMDPFKPFPE